MLTNLDLVELTAFRRELHRFPEVSGEEVETARRIVAALTVLSPSKILTGLGGHGVAAVSPALAQCRASVREGSRVWPLCR